MFHCLKWRGDFYSCWNDFWLGISLEAFKGGFHLEKAFVWSHHDVVGLKSVRHLRFIRALSEMQRLLSDKGSTCDTCCQLAITNLFGVFYFQRLCGSSLWHWHELASDNVNHKFSLRARFVHLKKLIRANCKCFSKYGADNSLMAPCKQVHWAKVDKLSLRPFQ